MYWCKQNVLNRAVLISGISILFAACRPDVNQAGGGLKYFDVKGYFTADTARLNHLKTPVVKTVTHNGAAETKTVTIDNWGRELDLFIGSDINRPAWKNSYTIIDNDGTLLYKAKDPDLKMREMIIKKDKQQHVKWILIFNRTQNILYKTTEKLSYFPDSLYLIEKDQKVKLMDANHYRIEGKIKH